MAVTGGVVTPYAAGSPPVTFAVSAAVVAGKLVEISGNMTVAHAAAGSRKCIGMALQSGSAIGDKIAVQLFGDVCTLTAAGAVTAGDELVVGAVAGTVSTLAASGAGYVQAEANNARAIVGIGLEAISDTLTGRVLVTGA